jgi:hypothetical protein
MLTIILFNSATTRNKMCIHQNCSTKLKWDYLQGRHLGGHMCKEEEEDKVKICCLKLVLQST